MDSLSVGDDISIDVVRDGSNPKKLVFRAQFLNKDFIVGGYPSIRLVRVRNFRALGLMVGDIYLLRVVDISVSLEKTKDGRLKVFVDCEVIRKTGRFLARKRKLPLIK